MFDAELNKRVLENLIRCGAFDSMGIYRSRLLEAYEQLVDSIAQNKRKNLAGQFDLFGGGGDQMQSARSSRSKISLSLPGTSS